MRMEECRTQEVRLALKKLADDRRVTQVANDIGVKPKQLHDIIAKGGGSAEVILRVIPWLMSHGYLKGVSAPVQPDKPPDEDAAIEAMCKDLEGLVAVLRSPISKAQKARAFGERIAFWNQSMREYLRQEKEGKQE